MSKKKGKKPQQNLSLKDRLEKHWNNRKWDAFVSLYMRDTEASMRTRWADHWQDALYNCLTSALFVDRDFRSVEMALDLIRREGERFSPDLHDCADVASDFLTARKNARFTDPTPLREEATLPSPYASLRGDLASLAVASRARKSKKNETVALVEKLAAQHARLGKAKSASPWSTWLKIAQQLETATGGEVCAGTFRAVRAIVALSCELFCASGENALRDVSELPKNPLFRSIPENCSHPVIEMLWDFFCRSGERKYGEEWGAAARVLQLSFTGREQLKGLKARYGRLMRKREDEGPENLLLFLLSGASSPNASSLPASPRWSEQEHYVLRVFFALHYDGEAGNFEGFLRFLESFEILGRIGRRWRTQIPWTQRVRECFDEMLLEVPQKMLPMLTQMDLPWEAAAAPGLVYIGLSDRHQLEAIRKKAPSRFPLRLSPEEIERLLRILPPWEVSREKLRTIRAILDDAGYVALFVKWVETIVVSSGEDASEGAPPSRQAWGVFGTDLLEELAGTLPPGGVESCLCRLRVGEKALTLSADPSKVEAFFGALASEIEEYKRGRPTRANRVNFWVYLFIILLKWPEVPPHFLTRLFEMTFSLHRLAADDDFIYWGRLATIMEGMKNETSRKIVASCILDNMNRLGKKEASWSLGAARVRLERLAKRKSENTKNTGSKSRAQKSSSPKKKRDAPSEILEKQGLLPFEEN